MSSCEKCWADAHTGWDSDVDRSTSVAAFEELRRQLAKTEAERDRAHRLRVMWRNGYDERGRELWDTDISPGKQRDKLNKAQKQLAEARELLVRVSGDSRGGRPLDFDPPGGWDAFDNDVDAFLAKTEKSR